MKLIYWLKLCNYCCISVPTNLGLLMLGLYWLQSQFFYSCWVCIRYRGIFFTRVGSVLVTESFFLLVLGLYWLQSYFFTRVWSVLVTEVIFLLASPP